MTARWGGTTPWVLGALLLLLTASRLCHSGILWSDGDYHLAAAMQMHDGKTLYRDLWYDKPPLTALLLDVAGRPQGWALSIFEALVAWLGCVFAFLTARQLGSRKAGWIAATLLAFFLTFYIPTAVIPIAPDLLMIAPHLAAVYLTLSRHTWLAGVASAVAFAVNTKGIFVLAACLAMAPAQAVPILLGFAIPCAGAALTLVKLDAWNGYLDQAWRWGLLYARSSPVANPWGNAISRTANWAGFHAALIFGAILHLRRRATTDWVRFAIWLGISYLAVAQGVRFLPRYWFQLLAPLAVVAGLGFASVRNRAWVTVAAVLALSVPLVRFGPAYFKLAMENRSGRPHRWADLALDQDDREIAALISKIAPPGATLFVWGYRPGIYCYTRLDSPSLFWDSQPLTGVPADRHLHLATNLDPAWAKRNREQFALTRPAVLVDALSIINPQLAMDRYPELQPLLAHYRHCGQTALSNIYCIQ